MSELPHVFDATTETFETEVLQKSLQVPVLVDFWATWCGPCKSLGPILEKLAGEYHGGFELAKVDVDKEQQIAAAFQIRSVPTVYLVKGGQIVDGFPGAMPEGQLREFLSHHGIAPAEAAEEAIEEAAPAAPAVSPASSGVWCTCSSPGGACALSASHSSTSHPAASSTRLGHGAVSPE